MKVIVAGGREFNDDELLYSTLLGEYKDLTNLEIVCGMARGADLLGKTFADEMCLPVKEFPADWKGLGRKAGPLRNIQMAEYADELVAFWDGKSKGTKHMIDEATRRGLKVKAVSYESTD